MKIVATNLIIIITITAFATSSSSAFRTKFNVSEFISGICNCTEHKDLCRWSLIPYARLLHDHPYELPYVAVNVSLSAANNASRYAQALEARFREARTSSNMTLSALCDCTENLSGVVCEIEDSLKQARSLVNSSRSESDRKLYVNNLETWMSAALTYDDTCQDAMADLDEPFRTGVSKRTSRLFRFLSNALALITDYCNKNY